MPPARPAPVTCTINESYGYRYLGWRSSSDISDTLATSHIIKTINGLYLRYFRFNLTIRRCSPTLQLQLLHSNVIGPVIYLLSMLSVNSATKAKFDRHLRRFVRPIFGLSNNTPNSIVDAVGRLIPFKALQGRERARLCMQLADPLDRRTAIAHAVFNGVSSERPGRTLAHANVPVRFKNELASLNLIGIAPPPEDPPHYRAAIEAGLFGDRIALQKWQHDARVSSAIADPVTHTRALRTRPQPQSHSMPLKLPRALPNEHAADVYFGFSQPIGIGPIKHGLVPMSYSGPGGTSIVALSNLPCAIVSIVARLQTGNIALRRHPWRPRNPVRPAPRTGTGNPGADDEFSEADTESIASSSGSDDERTGDSGPSDTPDTGDDEPSTPSVVGKRRHPRRAIPTKLSHPAVHRKKSPHSATVTPNHPAALPCRFCNHGHEHPAHIFFECTAGRLPDLRELLLPAALAEWERLLTKIEAAHRSAYSDPEWNCAAERLAVQRAYTGGTSCDETIWLTHRLLWALPWPAYVVPLGAASALALGQLFDSTILSRHALRPTADSWVSWARKWSEIFGGAWCDLLRNLHHPGQSQPPAGYPQAAPTTTQEPVPHLSRAPQNAPKRTADTPWTTDRRRRPYEQQLKQREQQQRILLGQQQRLKPQTQRQQQWKHVPEFIAWCAWTILAAARRGLEKEQETELRKMMPQAEFARVTAALAALRNANPDQAQLKEELENLQHWLEEARPRQLQLKQQIEIHMQEQLQQRQWLTAWYASQLLLAELSGERETLEQELRTSLPDDELSDTVIVFTRLCQKYPDARLEDALDELHGLEQWRLEHLPDLAQPIQYHQLPRPPDATASAADKSPPLEQTLPNRNTGYGKRRSRKRRRSRGSCRATSSSSSSSSSSCSSNSSSSSSRSSNSSSSRSSISSCSSRSCSSSSSGSISSRITTSSQSSKSIRSSSTPNDDNKCATTPRSPTRRQSRDNPSQTTRRHSKETPTRTQQCANYEHPQKQCHHRLSDPPSCSEAATRYLEETLTAAGSSSDISSHSCAALPRQQRHHRQFDFADYSGAPVRTSAYRSSLGYLQETPAAARRSSCHSCTVSLRQQRRCRQPDFAVARTPTTPSSPRYLEETTAAASRCTDSSHSCEVSLRQQRRRRQLDFADCSGAAVRASALQPSLRYPEETPSAAGSSSDSSSHSCAASPRQQRRRRQLDFAD